MPCPPLSTGSSPPLARSPSAWERRQSNAFLGTNGLRTIVSKKKKRFECGGFNLDLSYISRSVIAMGFPSKVPCRVCVCVRVCVRAHVTSSSGRGALFVCWSVLFTPLVLFV